MDFEAYWEATLAQDADKMATFFHEDAVVRWHNTREEFTASEFIAVNCAYPNTWAGQIERLVVADHLVIAVLHVFSTDGTVSDHVTSFMEVRDDKIVTIDEYWGNDGPVPDWRQAMGLGKRF